MHQSDFHDFSYKIQILAKIIRRMQYYTANVYNKIVKYTGTFRNKTNIYVWVFYADTGENVVICKTKSLAFFLSLGHFMLCIKIAVEDFILEKCICIHPSC